MDIKLNPRRYFWMVLVALLTACAPFQTVAPDVQSTAIAILQTSVALTQTALPTATPPPPTVTPTATVIVILPTPPPTQPPIPILTPDAIQVENWQEYQTELAKIVLSLSGIYPYQDYEYALCEWDILGRSNQEVYVYAVCIGPSIQGNRPVVIYLELDGSIREVRFGGYKETDYNLELFPENVREKIDLYYSGNSYFVGRVKEMYDHLAYREIHPEVPPLNVLSTIPAMPSTP